MDIIAVPTADGRACAHFGRCENFMLFEVGESGIAAERIVAPPEHRPGSYPAYLADLGVGTVLAGGMGVKARDLFADRGIAVHLGADGAEPRELVSRFLAGRAPAGGNACSHGTAGHRHHEDCGRGQ